MWTNSFGKEGREKNTKKGEEIVLCYIEKEKKNVMLLLIILEKKRTASPL